LHTVKLVRGNQPEHYREEEGKERDLVVQLEKLYSQHEQYRWNIETRLGTQTLPIRTRGAGSDTTKTTIPPAPDAQRDNLQSLNAAVSSNNNTQTREIHRLNDGTAALGNLVAQYREQVQVEPQRGDGVLEQIDLAMGNMQQGREWDEAERQMRPDSASSQGGGAQVNEPSGADEDVEMRLGSDSPAEDAMSNIDLYEDPPPRTRKTVMN
jgi:hypothetical protein